MPAREVPVADGAAGAAIAVPAPVVTVTVAVAANASAAAAADTRVRRCRFWVITVSGTLGSCRANLTPSTRNTGHNSHIFNS